RESRRAPAQEPPNSSGGLPSQTHRRCFPSAPRTAGQGPSPRSPPYSAADTPSRSIPRSALIAHGALGPSLGGAALMRNVIKRLASVIRRLRGEAAANGNGISHHDSGTARFEKDTLEARILMSATAGDDNIAGTTGDDNIDALAGNDTVTGDLGNDTILGNLGNDSIDGGAGNDSLDGGAGNDTLFGGAGNDTIVGGAGTDVVNYVAASGGVTVNL